ncbi:potassium transporter Kup [Propionivibrio sp.]|uniref:potassium transporter Kup n=1 Tax=Propionivibrio sp. TaxID=2212460 RepID=UPI0025CC8033|nr:potassium transporter Kup [Propionivibrio sp.]MBK7356282.1 potassium transporter Kup [Propionivibrio sp.]MBK8746177.1 potassium transporter Kup [Propionivibrio sp.]MBK8894512.1 potassium transporter Kup [Propionivibrio sp.]MBL0208335.1 potassium transporter Kup [Propionivibrio sp.]
MHSRHALPALTISAIGVVFGDIGTSPLYAMKEIFNGHHPIPVTPENIFGILSMVFWSIMVMVTIKYVAVIMRADNRGEGGSLALLALITDRAKSSGLTWIITLLGIFAAALFYGDSMITPAISVLSAVEGLEIVAPTLKPYVVPVTLGVLSGLFFIQKRGTGTIGMLFGPVMILWFAILGVLGVIKVAHFPGVLAALNPVYAVNFISTHTGLAFLALGSVVLAVTGGEALYTDMGHFGPFPIRLAWFGFVMPTLVLNYFGQGALLLYEPQAIENPFFHMAPSWALVPLVILATMATIIASQAVISGAFSVARQAIQMGFLPRMLIVHTSGKAKGQIYVPFTNWTLYLAVIALVIGFKNSSNLAAAYGIAVTGTMMIDTILVAFVMVLMWRWHWSIVAVVAGTLFMFDLAFFSSNILKIPAGGWFPIAIGLASFTVLTTWRLGRRLIGEEMAKQSIPIDAFLDSIFDVHRVNGTAVFMTSSKEGVPAALLHNLKHNQVLHERVVLVTVQTTDTPYVLELDRIYLHKMRQGFVRLIIRYGFMEDPDIPGALMSCKRFGESFDFMETTFYLSRETIVPKLAHQISPLRARLFALMSKNATSATEFFKIPTDRVVELGTQLEI